MAQAGEHRIWRGIGALAAAAVLALVAVQSCVLDGTETAVCASGRRCPTGWRCAAFQDVCISNGCGDGTLDLAAGERCDDGNIIEGDGCSADCGTLEGCGNGAVDPGEVCD